MMDNREIYYSDLRAAGACAGFLRGRRVLITGATGLIGSFIADALMLMNAEDGAAIDIFAAGRSEAGVRKRFASAVDGERFRYVFYDAAKPLTFDFGVDFIIHAACAAHPRAYAADPVGTMQANLSGTMALLEYLRAQDGARMVFLSTGEIYGENPELADGFRETDCGWIDPMNPRACYPESKRAAETLCAAYVAQYGVDALVARLCHVYGPTFTAVNSRADAQFLRNALQGEDIVMKSTGAQVRSYCYVADAARAVFALLERGGRGQAYNVANRHSVASIREYAETLADVGGVRVRFEMPEAIERAGYTKISRAVLNPEKLEGLGWQPKYPLREGLEHTFRCAGEIGR